MLFQLLPMLSLTLLLFCVLQALMAVSPFCSMMQQLTAAGPALDAATSPTLTALASLAAAFKPVAPPEPAAEEGWSEAPKGKRSKVGWQPCVCGREGGCIAWRGADFVVIMVLESLAHH
jgi:hypothetical protein